MERGDAVARFRRAAGALLVPFLLAACGGGGGGAKAPAGGTILPPGAVLAAAGPASVTVSWSPVSGAASYVVWWGSDPAVTKGVGTAVPVPSSPFVLSGRTPGLPLYFAVASVDGAGREGDAAPTESATPAPVAPPGNVQATAGEGSVTLSWSPAAGAGSYVVWWGTDPAVTETGTAAAVAESPWTRTGLSPGVPHYFAVTSSVGSAWQGDPSPTVSATPLAPPPPPGTPTDVGQYFDRAIRAPGGTNHDDASSHPLVGLTDNTAGSLLFGFSVNCLQCHYGSGPPRTSNECLKCHFEGGNAPGSNHGDGVLQLALVPGDGSAPTAPFSVGTLADYDAWCLQCHGAGGANATLGGRAATAARRTLLDGDAWARSRHRAQSGPYATGCITCHAPHGDGNGQLVRSNPAHRAGAGGRPRRFGVFPYDNLDAVPPAYGRTGPQRTLYRARTDNTVTDASRAVFADAGDDGNYCNSACHSVPKDRSLLREGTTGLYLLTPGNRKVTLVGGIQYTIDNEYLLPSRHSHLSLDIIPTADMKAWYEATTGDLGGDRFGYPRLVSGDPAAADFAWNASWNAVPGTRGAIPFFPDHPDGERDFPNGYLDRGPVRYRFSCSTCHDPHGTGLPNATHGNSGFPDMRLPGNFGSTLCRSCHL